MTDPRLARPLWRGRTNVDAYTIAWVEHAEQIKRERWPKRPELHHEFYCTQGSYQGGGGDPDSGNTHALGGPVDLRWCGHPECLLALRLAGGFVWWRRPLWRNGVLVWPDHIHGGPIGHPYMDPSAQRQETAYLNRRNGLADNGPDDGPRLDPIPRPMWPWPQEEDMSQYADQLDTIERLLRKSLERDTARMKRVVALLARLRKEAKVDAKVLAEIEAALTDEP